MIYVEEVVQTSWAEEGDVENRGGDRNQREFSPRLSNLNFEAVHVSLEVSVRKRR